TSGIPCEFDLKASQDVWTYYLASTIPEAAVFLQEFAGYCLTTDTRHEIAVWLYGPAGSGKSTFITGIQAMLGERAGLLGLADIERSRFALGGLPGKTLMVSAEQPASFMTTSYVLNGLISGEPITIERKYRDSTIFTPTAKLLWAMNELPRIPDAGNGLFRRVKVVQFPRLSVNPNPDLKEEIKRMGTGILAWAVEGLYRLQSRGHFKIPECVMAATDGFRESNDIPLAFVDECCIRGGNNEIQSSTLYSEYVNWCSRSGHKPQSSTTIARDWERLGFVKRRTANGVFWQGVQIINVQTM
ncbi:MAG: DNA primase family protein, partial [Bellilinea sp.]